VASAVTREGMPQWARTSQHETPRRLIGTAGFDGSVARLRDLAAAAKISRGDYALMAVKGVISSHEVWGALEILQLEVHISLLDSQARNLAAMAEEAARQDSGGFDAAFGDGD
jgi:hypothetical protein